MRVKQIEFARLLGIARSYVTKLKADGRLVMDGMLVDVEASRLRIVETADPNRDDVASRWAVQRALKVPIAPTTLTHEDTGEDETLPATGSYATARARKENAQADIAEMERDKQRGQLIERAAVAAAIEDIMTAVRQALEQQPHRIAPLLVGNDLDYIRATLKQEINDVLALMSREFGQRLRQLAGEDNDGEDS